jgi:hypothetical protein
MSHAQQAAAEKRLRTGVSGVVDQVVDLAELVHRGLDDAVGEFRFRDVPRHRDGAAAGLADRGRHRVALLRVDVRHNDVRALVREQVRGRLADALACANGLGYESTSTQAGDAPEPVTMTTCPARTPLAYMEAVAEARRLEMLSNEGQFTGQNATSKICPQRTNEPNRRIQQLASELLRAAMSNGRHGCCKRSAVS